MSARCAASEGAWGTWEVGRAAPRPGDLPEVSCNGGAGGVPGACARALVHVANARHYNAFAARRICMRMCLPAGQ